MERKKNIFNYIAILAVCSFAGAGNYMNAAINTFQEAFPSISQSTIMLISTLPCLIAVPVMLTMGRLVGKRFTYRSILTAGTVLILAGGILPYFFSSNWTFILVCRTFLGIGAGCYGVRNSFIIRSVPDERLVSFTGYSTVALTMGGTLAGPVVGILATRGWNYSFLYNLVTAVILVLVLIGLREPEGSESTDVRSAESDCTGKKLSWKIYFYVLVQFASICVLYPMAVSGVSVYFDTYGIGSSVLAGTVMSLFPLFGVLSNMILGSFMRTFRRFTIPAMSALVIISAVLCLFWYSVITSALCYILCGIGYHVIIGVLQVYNGLEAPPDKLAAGSTMILAGKSIGIFLSSYFITLCSGLFNLKDRINIENAFLGCLIVYMVLAAFTLAVDITPAEKHTENCMQGN